MVPGARETLIPSPKRWSFPCLWKMGQEQRFSERQLPKLQMRESHFTRSILSSMPRAMCGGPTILSGGHQISLFAFSAGLHLESGCIVDPSVGRLLPFQVKERGGHEGLVLISALPARSIRRVRRPGAHLQAVRSIGVLKQPVPLRPLVRGRALHLVTRRAGRRRVRSPGQETAAPSCL